MPRIPVPQVEQTVGVSGPLQDPVARGGQLGDYAGQADQGLAHVGREAAYYAELRENDQAMAWATNAASAFKLQQFGKFKDGQDTAAPGADGFTKQYIDNYDKDAQEVLGQAPTPRAKKYLTTHLDTFRTTMGEKAMEFEAVQGYDQRENDYIQSVKNSGQLVYQDPSQYPHELQTLRQTAADLKTHPNFRAKAADLATKELTDQYWAARSQTDPQGTVNELRAGVPVSAQPMSGIPEQIKAEANANGKVDPHTALAFAYFESGGTPSKPFNPSATNGKSVGLYQFQPDTAAEYGIQDRLDPAQNIKGGIAFMAANQKAFKDTLKRDPSVSELYAMHLLGTGGGMALAKADNSMPFDTLAKKLYKNPDQVESQNHLSGMTVGQVKDTFASWMDRSMRATQGMADAPATTEDAQANASSNPAVANLSLADRMKWLTHAQNLLRKDDTQEKAALADQVKNAIGAYSEGNDAPRPDRGEVLRLNGPVQGGIINREIDGWQDYAHSYAQLKTMGPQEQAQFLAETKPDPSKPGFDGANERWGRLAAAADKINQARRDDLIGFDQTAGAHVTQDIDWTQPLAYSGPLAGRFQQADQLSKQYQVPFQAFKKSDINTLGPMLEHAPPQQAVDVLRQIHASADSENHYQKAIAQLAPNHPSLAVAGSLPEIGYAGIQNPAQYVLRGEQILHPDKSDKAEEGRTPTILMPKDKPGNFRDSWDKTVGGAFPSSLSSNQYLNAAIAYYIGKQDPAKRSEILDTNLWKEAVNVVAPSVDWVNGKVLVPQGVYANGFRDTVNKVWPVVMQQYGLNPDEHNAASYPLKNTPDGKYAVTNGTTTLYGANGYPVVFGLDGSVPPMQAPVEEPPPAARLGKMRDPLQLPMKKSTR